jgi:hypothetical protein
MTVGDLTGNADAGRGNSWTATVSIRVVTDGGAAVSGATVSGSWSTGGSSSCTTVSTGWCSVSTSVNAKKATSTTYTVSGVTHSSLVYQPGSKTSITVTLN